MPSYNRLDTPRAGKMLRFARKTAGLKTVRLAELLDVSTQALYQIETGKAGMRRGWLALLPSSIRDRVLKAYLKDIDAYREETIALAKGKPAAERGAERGSPPIYSLQITPAMLQMSRRNANWMLRKDVIKRAQGGKSFDEIAIDLLQTEPDTTE